MDNQRLFLFVALSFVMLLLWQSWVEDYGPVAPPESAVPQTQTTTDPLPGGMPRDSDDIPSAAGESSAQVSALPESELLKTDRYIEVETDLFKVRIDTTGGDLRQADLLAYADTTAKDSPPFRLLNDTMPNLFVIQSGLRASVMAMR